jgi:hypothetical protein
MLHSLFPDTVVLSSCLMVQQKLNLCHQKLNLCSLTYSELVFLILFLGLSLKSRDLPALFLAVRLYIISPTQCWIQVH